MSPTSTTKRFLTIGWVTMQRASTMLMPASANVRREVLEQPVAVPAVDLELDLERASRVAVPADRDEALRVLAQRVRVGAVLAVDGDAAAERDVADDVVARDRAAALGQPQRDVLDALDADAVLRRVALGPARRLARGDEVLGDRRLVVGRLARLQALHDLVDDDLGRDLGAAERDVEVVGLAVAHLADHVRQQRRAGDLLRRQAGLLEVLLQQLAARCARSPRATRP